MVEENFSRSREGGFRGGRFPPKPVKIGEEYQVEITETSQRGDGIARIEGLVIFVPKAKIGDHIRIKIIRISRKFAEAEPVEKEETEGTT